MIYARQANKGRIDCGTKDSLDPRIPYARRESAQARGSSSFNHVLRMKSSSLKFTKAEPKKDAQQHARNQKNRKLDS